ncbi:MAG: hypothetical protein ACFCD0_16375 [Gemmataceae bacterium]
MNVPLMARLSVLVVALCSSLMLVSLCTAQEQQGPDLQSKLRQRFEAIEQEILRLKEIGKKDEECIKTLVERFRNAERGDPELRREKRILVTLSRIDSPVEIEYLRELASGTEEAFRTTKADSILKPMGK